MQQMYVSMCERECEIVWESCRLAIMWFEKSMAWFGNL